MKTDKNSLDAKLAELFSEMPLDNPSTHFTEKLLLRIEKEVLREKRKQQWLIAGQIAAGVAGILLLPALIIYLCTLYLPHFSFPDIHIHFEPNIVITGLSFLTLLICDTLFRMHISNRTKKD